MRLTTSRPTPAFVLALVALVFSMAGTGYAAAQISGSSIKSRSVSAQKVVTNALTGVEIKESSLGLVPRSTFAFSAESAASADTAKVADTAKAADVAKTADTATTAKTADTALVADKAKDADKLGGREPSEYLRSARTVRSVTFANVAINNGAETTAFCNPGEIAVGGGAGWFFVGTDTSVGSATVSTMIPVTDAGTNRSGFRGEGKNTSTVARDFKVYAICMAG
ncbi:hypothetical protein DSM112329_01697 [Paraconexibacter sp. AEG42_29]|uniref:Uncharacterized protein n=1 Tax=Paraconexibacter sp. AEG42_29 TaxID=2997339 RepID=A0AAU7ATD2_9ACTN